MSLVRVLGEFIIACKGGWVDSQEEDLFGLFYPVGGWLLG